MIQLLWKLYNDDIEPYIKYDFSESLDICLYDEDILLDDFKTSLMLYSVDFAKDVRSFGDIFCNSNIYLALKYLQQIKREPALRPFGLDSRTLINKFDLDYDYVLIYNYKNLDNHRLILVENMPDYTKYQD